MELVVLKITDWNPALGWSSDVAHTKSMLVGLVRQSTALSHTEAKRLIKAVFARQVSELVLANGQFYNAIRSALQSEGAQVEAQLAQLGIQPAGPASGGSAG